MNCIHCDRPTNKKNSLLLESGHRIHRHCLAGDPMALLDRVMRMAYPEMRGDNYRQNYKDIFKHE